MGCGKWGFGTWGKILLLVLFCATSGWLTAEELLLTKGKPLAMTIKPEESGECAIEIPGGAFLALRVTMEPDVQVHVRMIGKFTKGGYETELTAERDLYGAEGADSLLDSLPQFPGRYSFEVRNDESKSASFTLELVDLGPLPQIPIEEQTGFVVVRKAAKTGVQVKFEMRDDDLGGLTHPTFDYTDQKPEVTPEGDVVLQVPPGLWKLYATSKGEALSSIVSNFVPVISGKTTTVENWPVYEDRSASDSAGTSGLKIRQVASSGEDVQVRFSTPDWQGNIEKQDVEAFEGGMPAQVLSVKRVETPLHLVVLLDSSGSMKTDLKAVLAAAENFFKALPASTQVELIDFDTKAHPLPCKTRAELFKALKNIKADGSTALNDTVILGLTRAEAYDRSAVLLFTDGFDANHNDTGPGSQATPDEMFETGKKAEIPLFTIGYGKKPDDATLRRLASLSGGAYYRAQEQTVGKVFERLNALLGREFEMVYRRPGITAPSDVPVICIVQDRSGSMNSAPDEEGTCGYRMEEAKEILRNFVNHLPEGAVAQIMGFEEFVDFQQVWTSNREALLRGIAQLFAFGGTDIYTAIDTAYRSLKAVPSRRRYLLFVTDAALSSPSEDESLLTLFGLLKDAGIQCTWVGMVKAEQRGPFDEVASFTSGFAAVSPDAKGMREAVEQLGKRIAAEKAEDKRLEVQVMVSKKSDSGKPLIMSDANLFPLPPSPRTATASVHGVHYVVTDGTPKTTHR